MQFIFRAKTPNPEPRTLNPIFLVLIAVLLGCAPIHAEPEKAPLEWFKQIGFDQKLGEQLPLDLKLVDETGKSVALGEYFGSKPVVLIPVQLECNNLSLQVLNGFIKALTRTESVVGRDFTVLVVSFDPAETPAMARNVKQAAVVRYGKPESRDGWRYLTGTRENVERLMGAVGFRFVHDESRHGEGQTSGVLGFRFKRDPDRKSYGHSAGILVLTPEGKPSQYYFASAYNPADIDAGLRTAAQNRIGFRIEDKPLYCLHYDPVLGKHSRTALTAMKIGVVATLAALAVFLFVMIRRDRRGLSTSTPQPSLIIHH